VIAAHHEDETRVHHLVHADFYRIESVGELEAAGWLDWLAPGTVVAAEWGDRFPGAFPGDCIEVRIERPARGAQDAAGEAGADERRIDITPRGPRARATLARMLRAGGAEARAGGAEARPGAAGDAS
jgi:tRNA A37 threonylcarbamoyladenosine biosynthesis protein TsaE